MLVLPFPPGLQGSITSFIRYRWGQPPFLLISPILMKSKAEIREFAKKRRASFFRQASSASLAQLQQQLISNLNRLFYTPFEKRDWLLYSPIHSEFPTALLHQFISQRDENCFYPISQAGALFFYQVDDPEQMTSGEFGKVPNTKIGALDFSNPVIAICPGIGFSKTLDRVGYGKGFYDRFFDQHRHHEIFKLGLGFDCQLLEQNWQVDKFDQKLDGFICPSGFWGRLPNFF